LKWNDNDNIRTMPQFADMIRVSTSIIRYKRKTVEGKLIAIIEGYP
jgi:hypothetical protein